MTAILRLETVRSIAIVYGYAEVQFNEAGRVISFKSLDGMIRVNVYYTTGTVVACLSHPNKGKTQLFCRNQTLVSLPSIFRNPRTHTGEGYYLVDTMQGNRRWAPIKHTSYDDESPTACDDAQRWRFVQAATNFCSAQQVSQIAATCELWNEIRFDQSGPPLGMSTRLNFRRSVPLDVATVAMIGLVPRVSLGQSLWKWPVPPWVQTTRLNSYILQRAKFPIQQFRRMKRLSFLAMPFVIVCAQKESNISVPSRYLWKDSASN